MEVFTIIFDYKGTYFEDAWNAFDFLLMASLGTYITNYYYVDEKEELLHILAFVNLVSCLRGFSYMRCYEPTRIFIYLLVSVVKVMGPFMTVAFFGLYTLSSSYSILYMANE